MPTDRPDHRATVFKVFLAVALGALVLARPDMSAAQFGAVAGVIVSGYFAVRGPRSIRLALYVLAAAIVVLSVGAVLNMTMWEQDPMSTLIGDKPPYAFAVFGWFGLVGGTVLLLVTLVTRAVGSRRDA